MFKGHELNDILSFEEFLEYMGIARTLGYKLLTSGEIRGIKVGKVWRKVFFTPSDTAIIRSKLFQTGNSFSA